MSSVRTQFFFLWTAFISVSASPLKVLKPNGDCMPGELVWVECNLCTCNPQGKPNQVCAAMWCQPVPTTSKPQNQQNIETIIQSSGPKRNLTHNQPSVNIVRAKVPETFTEIVNNNLPPIETTTSGSSQAISSTMSTDHSMHE